MPDSESWFEILNEKEWKLQWWSNTSNTSSNILKLRNKINCCFYLFLIFRTLDNLNFALSNCHKRFAKIHTFSIDLNSYERVILFSSVSFVFQIPIKIYEHLLLMNQLSFCKFLFWHRFMSLFGVKWSTFYWNHLYEFYLNLYLNYGQLSTHI